MVGAASLALGAFQTVKGLIDASQAQDPTQVQETAEMKAARERARQMAQSGFTPQEKAAFKQSLAASGNTAFRRAVDIGGGNLSAAIRAGINSQQLGAQNQFASQDAQLRRQNIGMSNSLEQGYQGLKNTQVAQNNALAQQQNQAASQSVNSGMSNLGSALNLQQALNYQPNAGGVNVTNAPITQPFGTGVPTMTPSGQMGNSYYNPTTIGQFGNAQATQNPYMFQQNPYANLFGGGLGGNYNIGNGYQRIW